jgi:CDP-glucose 4,6-dehydratase
MTTTALSPDLLDGCFAGAYRGRRVLITGHTGFKGSWLALWLHALGARVTGYSAYLPSEPNNFTVCNLAGLLDHRQGDVRDFAHLQQVFAEVQPEIVFHLAAQPIVRISYDNPKETFDTNVGGTVNVLECIRRQPGVRAAVLITSDKCYRNAEWVWGYRENDPLGGDDPYSASKGCAEIVIRSYWQSFFAAAAGPRLVSVRAGNVIGGGDWATARIVPDCMRAWAGQGTLVSRSPEATRPWQHVLEPLGGYLLAGADLLQRGDHAGEAYNFGPDGSVNQTVRELIAELARTWPGGKWEFAAADAARKESGLLKLSCDKALLHLHWHAVLSFAETACFTAAWYQHFYGGGSDMLELSRRQLADYIRLARERKLAWAGA